MLQKYSYVLGISLLLLLLSCHTAPHSAISFGEEEEATYRKTLKTLASDDFLGRQPFTKGEEMTLNYLAMAFDSLGIEPGNNGSYFQEVPMMGIKSSFKQDEVVLKSDNQEIHLSFLEDIVGANRKEVQTTEIHDAPIVFVGFGINAPEYEWNDYEEVNVKGKIVLVMINDPGFYEDDLFRGKDMTYYGRWTYKFEEAARQGAKGVLIIHDTAPASYGWGVVRAGWSDTQLYLESDDGNKDFPDLEGWITQETTAKLFDLAQVENPEELMNKAKQPGFKAVDLSVELSATLENQIEKSQSKNVIAVLPGNSKPDEYIIYSAHWDHLGIGEAVDGDSIYNGAADNASGVAALLTLAEKFKKTGSTQRTQVFFVPTAEESGLLGSEYYTKNPVYPLKNTVIDINFDVLQPFGLMKDIYLVGKGQSEADAYLEKAAENHSRIVKAVEDPSDGWYYRSDHFNFAKAGIPTLYIGNGIESVEHGREWGEQQKKKYNDERYHKPQDNYSDDWNVSGTMADLQLIFEVGQTLGNSSDFPKWNEGVLYKRIRENH